MITFRTARAVADSTPELIGWRALPWAASGAITEVVGKIKAAGKTTWILAMVRAVLDGLPFMGQPTAKSPVVYLTEQSPATFREALRRAELLDREDLSILTWRDTLGVGWREVVVAAVAECQRIGAGLLVIDTLGQFAGLKGEGENSAGEALAAVQPLQAASADGLAVIIARHERKGGGEVGESGRGSSAFAGAVDIVLAIRRSEGHGRPSVRVIRGLSRFDETPDTLVIDLTDEGFVALGDETAVAYAEARDAVAEHLPAEGAGLTVDELMERTSVKRPTLQRVLGEMVGAETAYRSGAGKRGDPYRYSVSAQPEEGVWAE